MKKKILLFVGMTFTPTIALYAFISIWQRSFNFAQWSSDAGGIYCGVGFGVWVFSSICTLMYIDTQWGR